MTTNLVPSPVDTTVRAPVGRGAVRPASLVAGVLLLAAAVVAASVENTGVSSVLLFVVLPDVALLVGIGVRHEPGQLPRRAVPAYNLLHSPAVPVAIFVVAATGVLGAYWLVAATTWAAHIAMDRGLGYGLRTRDGWQRG